ncbi:nucleotidyltransferase domain-containing protein [Leptospira sp. B5-022]|uniref:nucleotidyltransferase domain-containing protein n=1 Tax=Leptospira sp. B5-022 TaxID=1242992 RepID=UPI0012F66125|nr:nucleotidyltransferase domain-containing protein [Leptospira sp. B5-022]
MRKAIEKAFIELKRQGEILSIYQFGSSTRKENRIPRDIDLLFLISDNKHINYSGIYDLIRNISLSLSEIVRLPVDFTILTVQEESEMHFIEESKAILLLKL